MIDALLIHPWTGGKGKFPPLGLLCLAAYAEREGFEVEVCDAAALELSDEEVVELVRQLRPRCVGMSFMTPQWSYAMSLATAIHRAAPGALLVAGGIHPNVAAEATLRGIPAIDAVVLGEGEVTLVEILASLRNEGREAVRGIPGVATLAEGTLCRAPPRPLVRDLGTLPMPAWHKVALDAYTVPDATYGQSHGRAMLVYGSRGCPHQCIFCCVDGVFGPGHRRRPAIQLADEIEYLARDRGIREVMFVDDVLFQDRAHLLALCRELVARRVAVKWAGNARVDSRALDPEVLDAVADAGCVRIDLGVESGSLRILGEIQKRITLPQVHEAHRKLHARGFSTTTFMMVGHPSETIEDVRGSIRLLAQVETEYPQVGTETPFPGATLYDIALRNGWLRTLDWSEYVTHNARPVSRTRHFEPEEVFRLTCLVRRAGEIFGELARWRRRRPAIAPSRSPLAAAWRFARILAGRFGAPYQDDLSLEARARLVEAFLAKDADPERFEELLQGIGLADLQRLPLPSARTLDEVAAGLGPEARVLVVPNTRTMGAVLPVLRLLCRAEGLREVAVVCSELGRALCGLPDVAHPKLCPVARPEGGLTAAIRAYGDGFDAVIVPCLSFHAMFYARLVGRLLLSRPTSRPLHVVALGAGGHALRVSWSELVREALTRGHARANALFGDRLRSGARALRLARLARRRSSLERRRAS